MLHLSFSIPVLRLRLAAYSRSSATRTAYLSVSVNANGKAVLELGHWSLRISMNHAFDHYRVMSPQCLEHYTTKARADCMHAYAVLSLKFTPWKFVLCILANSGNTNFLLGARPEACILYSRPRYIDEIEGTYCSGSRYKKRK